MRDTYDILLDDRAGIQLGRNVMTGSTDDLHAPLKSRMIRFCPHESRKERVMDIYDAVRILVNHLF